ncbi:MAG: asparagine--tRNA ligase [Chitinivibrionales bacterium]|nr:asparagine--tRNA ligase [Chitinivibrionales bacterium]MBD3397262.1 asparagine--tRNA ligase [Chitinivibrionales bacterium]
MNTTTIKDVLSLPCAGDNVCVSGWLRTKRDAKDFSFLEVNDGSCLASLQVIADPSLQNYQAEVTKLATGSSVTVEGIVADSPGKGQKYELRASRLAVYGYAPSDYPLQKKRHSFEFLREIAHLRPRTNALGAVSRIRSSLSYAVHTFFWERGFKYVHTPIITASDCEGAGEMFRVTALDMENVPRNEEGGVDYTRDFFGKPASLTVSGQLEAEIFAMALSKVYTFGPTFRAENSNTPRHLAEFWMIEPEMAFCDLAGDMDLAEEFVRYLAGWVLDKDSADLELFNARVDTTVVETLQNIRDNVFERVSYTDAMAILEKNNAAFEYRAGWGVDIQTEHERYLAEEVFKKPVIVYDYPKDIKAFYMRQNDDEKTVRALDVLVPRIGELIGGSQREERHDVLLQRIRAMGLDEKDYWWYLDLRRFGGAPHAGFGLGFERLLLLVTGMKNIRDVIPFPRFPGNAEF